MVSTKAGLEPTEVFMTVMGIEGNVSLQWIKTEMRNALHCEHAPVTVGDPASLMFKKWRPALSFAVS